MSHYFLALAWGVTVSAAFWGWGKAAEFFVCHKNTLSSANQTALGISAIILFGGILNSVGFLTKNALLLMVLSGVLFHLLRNEKTAVGEGESSFSVPVFILLAAAIVFFMGFVFEYRVNLWDDPTAYFVFPKKIVETGSLGLDPFSERRLVPGLGAHFVLQSFLLTYLSIENLHILDPGLAIALLAFLIYDRARNKGLSAWASFSVGIIPFILPVLIKNASAQFLPLALNLSMLGFLDLRNSISNKQKLIFVSLLAAAACGLKSNWILPTLSLLFVFYTASLNERKKNGLLKEFAGILVMIFLFLLPYMASLYQSSGTMLFPFLGKGFHATSYGVEFSKNSSTIYRKIGGDLAGNFYFVACWMSLLIFCGHAALNKKIGDSFKTTLAVSISYFLVPTAFIFLIAFPNAMGIAYGQPAFLGCLLVVLIEILAIPQNYFAYQPSFLFWFVVTFMISSNCYEIPQAFRHEFDGMRKAFSGERIISAEEGSRYRLMQECVPKGQTVLAVLKNCYLLDFSRNQVFTADFPGEVSPPPGWPFLEGAEEFAKYLRGQSIRYVAFNQSWEIPKRARNPVTRHPRNWIDTQFILFTDTTHQLMDLKKIRKSLYDDGDICLIDLEAEPVKGEG